MSKPKTERNEKIVSLKDNENLSFRAIAKRLVELGFDDKEIDKTNVRKIYIRAKRGMETQA